MITNICYNMYKTSINVKKNLPFMFVLSFKIIYKKKHSNIVIIVPISINNFSSIMERLHKFPTVIKKPHGRPSRMKKNMVKMALFTFCLDLSPTNSTTLHTYKKQYHNLHRN